MTQPLTDIIWLHDDLRVADNPLLHFASPPEAMLVVYVLDERKLAPWHPDDEGMRLGPARIRFLWQSVMELRGQLLRLGSDLLVKIGSPADEMAALCQALRPRRVRVSHSPCADEAADIDALRAQLPTGTGLDVIDNNTLIDAGSLPFAWQEWPGSFSAFRRRVEKGNEIPAPLAAPVTLPPWPDDASRGFPPLQHLCRESADWQADSRGEFDYGGGEAAGHARLQDYLWSHEAIGEQAGPAYYKQTRNGLAGADFSTRFSAWLARGCLSPRQVHQAVKDWEASHGQCESSYWITFELLWRDYFHHAAELDGAGLFGRRALPPLNDAFNAWRTGRTGIPFIDAAMIELSSTGFLSNRARQNVASYLVKDLKVDWRLGAAWFEHCLIDFDAPSNWGNWRYVGGTGRDPRRNRYFNVLGQAERYDPAGHYVARWLPALADLPADQRHRPWQKAPEHFARPLAEPYD